MGSDRYNHVPCFQTCVPKGQIATVRLYLESDEAPIGTRVIEPLNVDEEKRRVARELVGIVDVASTSLLSEKDVDVMN